MHRRDCKHGRLKRSCEVCERDAEIERLQSKIVNLADRRQPEPPPWTTANRDTLIDMVFCLKQQNAAMKNMIEEQKKELRNVHGLLSVMMEDMNDQLSKTKPGPGKL